MEVALLMPLLTLILVGAVELGRLGYNAVEVSDAAYSGAVFGAQNHGTAADTTDIQLAASKDAADITGMTTTAATSCTCSDGTTVTCANATTNCVSPARVAEYVQVSTSATLSPLFNYPGLSSTWVMHGQATMRVEQ